MSILELNVSFLFTKKSNFYCHLSHHSTLKLAKLKNSIAILPKMFIKKSQSHHQLIPQADNSGLLGSI